MDNTIKIAGLKCYLSGKEFKDRIAYILYPMEMAGNVIEKFSQTYGVAVVLISGMDWESAFSPWPAKGVPDGSPDFQGESPEFLNTLQNDIIPRIESFLQVTPNVRRSLIGVSMSGLFTLWQWIKSDIFLNIASLSGSFWYDGFVQWLKTQSIPEKKGKAFFLLGDKESKTNIKAFQTVDVDTREVVSILQSSHIEVEFIYVPGNHYADPIPRLSLAFKALFADKS